MPYRHHSWRAKLLFSALVVQVSQVELVTTTTEEATIASSDPEVLPFEQYQVVKVAVSVEVAPVSSPIVIASSWIQAAAAAPRSRSTAAAERDFTGSRNVANTGRAAENHATAAPAALATALETAGAVGGSVAIEIKNGVRTQQGDVVSKLHSSYEEETGKCEDDGDGLHVFFNEGCTTNMGCSWSSSGGVAAREEDEQNQGIIDGSRLPPSTLRGPVGLKSGRPERGRSFDGEECSRTDDDRSQDGDHLSGNGGGRAHAGTKDCRPSSTGTGSSTSSCGSDGETEEPWQEHGGLGGGLPSSSLKHDRGISAPRAEDSSIYVVRWMDYHPVDDHHELLLRAWGFRDKCDDEGDCGGDDNDDCMRCSPDDSDVAHCGRSSCSGVGVGDKDGRRGEQGCVTEGGDSGGIGGFDWQLMDRSNAATTGDVPSDFSLIRLTHRRLQQDERLERAQESVGATCSSTPFPDSVLSEQERKGSSCVSPQDDKRRGRADKNILREDMSWAHVCIDQEEGNEECEMGGVAYEEGLEGRGRGEFSTRDGGERWKLCKADASHVLRRLRRSPWVKGVHLDKAFTRGIAAFGEPQQRKAAPDEQQFGDHASSNVNPAEFPSDTDFQPQKRNPRGTSRRMVDAEDEGGGKLRGSFRNFVHAGELGKPLQDKGFRGYGIRVAVFDTGLKAGGHDFSNVVERTNWTDEDTLEDTVGHGTHVAGVIAGRDPGCPGFAPDAELFIFRVFSSEQVSYTSWFLDAFNYALFLGVDVINLSIGGPDFKDQPFVEKVQELSANGIVVVSAVGNDGPTYGTQHNPADQMDTIGVGAVAAGGVAVASFQSRGMTTWELPEGYGRVKPDILAAGQHVLGPKAGDASRKCSGLSGTSVASPVVAGAVALLMSTVSDARKRVGVINPASIKQSNSARALWVTFHAAWHGMVKADKQCKPPCVLVESAQKIGGAGVFEQGSGVLNVAGAFKVLNQYEPRASLLPPKLDLTDPYMWPFSRQPLYYRQRPVIFNATVANGMGVTGRIRDVRWEETDVDYEASQHREGFQESVLDVKVDYSDVLWPWSGYLAVSLGVSKFGSDFEGIIEGTLLCVVESDPGIGEAQPRTTTLRLPITASVVRTPPRHRRLLWDQFHSVPYPPAYSPRDFLGDDSDMLDRLGDHPHTNFRTLLNALLDAGYYVDILGSDWTDFQASDYGAVLLVDPEDEMGEAEKAKLERDVKDEGLSLVVFTEWYSEDVMTQVRFVDDNTRKPWSPITGGSNIPAVNDFLLPAFGMALGGQTLSGLVSLPGGEVHFASGNAISRMPAGSLLVEREFHQGVKVDVGQTAEAPLAGGASHKFGLIGAVDTAVSTLGERERNIGGGRIFLFGDSSCIDDASLDNLLERKHCLGLFKSAVRYACEGFQDPDVFGDATTVSAEMHGQGGSSVPAELRKTPAEGYTDGLPLPKRPTRNELLKYSKVAYAALTGTKEEHDGPGGTASGRWKAVPRSVVAG